MRLDKFLADMRYGTRSEVKEIIKKKRVKVNGEVVKAADFKLSDDMEVMVDDTVVKYVEMEYYLLYKPAGYVTAREDNYWPVVMDLVDSRRKDLAPVGRLDKDTEGVLLITNDGMLNHNLLTEKNHVEKTYFAKVDADLPDNAQQLFAKPMVFSDFTSKPAKYRKVSDREAYLTIEEGKYHQVKRMFAKIGCEVTYLRRDKFGILTLDGLKPGQYRPLTKEEIIQLQQCV